MLNIFSLKNKKRVSKTPQELIIEKAQQEYPKNKFGTFTTSDGRVGKKTKEGVIGVYDPKTRRFIRLN